MVQEPLEAVALETPLEKPPLLQITELQTLDRGVHVAEEGVIVVQPDCREPGGVGRDCVQLGVDPTGDGVRRDKPREREHEHKRSFSNVLTV